MASDDATGVQEYIPAGDEDDEQPPTPRPDGNEIEPQTRAIGVATVLRQRYYVRTGSVVSGVTCKEEDDGCKTLSWNKCGCGQKLYGMPQYKIIWSRNHISFEPMSTNEERWKFRFLQEGQYTFRISVGEGPKSEPCYITVPESPDFAVNVLTWKKIRLAIVPVRFADAYRVSIFCNGELVSSHETKECNNEIDESKFKFEKGVKYSVIVHALCDGITSMPSIRKDFITGLEKPNAFNYDPDHGKCALKCTWENSKRMSGARIQLKTGENKLIVEEIVSESIWKYWGLKRNTNYVIILSPGDGERFFEDESSQIRHSFITAPSAPDKVEYRRYQDEKYLRFEVTSDYAGPFLVTVCDTSGRPAAETPRMFETKYFRVNFVAKRNTIFTAKVQCKFGDYLSPPTQANALGSPKCLEFSIGENGGNEQQAVSQHRRPRTLSTQCLDGCNGHHATKNTASPREASHTGKKDAKAKSTRKVHPETVNAKQRQNPKIHPQRALKKKSSNADLTKCAGTPDRHRKLSAQSSIGSDVSNAIEENHDVVSDGATEPTEENDHSDGPTTEPDGEESEDKLVNEATDS